MTTSGLAVPPRAAPIRARSPERKPPARIPSPRRPPSSYERVLAASLALSVLAHVVALLLSPWFIEVGVPPGQTAESAVERPDRFGLEMIVPIPSATAPETQLPEPEAEVSSPVAPSAAPPRVTPTDPSISDQPATQAPGGPSARDALRPGFRDPRLYVAPRPFQDLDRSDHERYMDHFQARIDALNDSMNVAASRERRTADWTVTDRDGNRWGLSPDGLHLGGTTIPRELLPTPAPTGDNQSIEAERERLRQREEIRRQEEQRERQRVQEERIRASEERR